MQLIDYIFNNIRYMNTRPEHGAGIHEVIKSAFEVPPDPYCDTCMNAEHVRQQLTRFPEGQFVALAGNHVVGAASTLRVSYPPEAPPLSWMEVLGDLGLRNHEPNGEWLYGAEMAVDRRYHGLGIGSQLYQIRFDLVRRLNLRGWYAGGSLLGYYRYRDSITVTEYCAKVFRREIEDPTVTMQLNRGFEGWRVIENYNDEPNAGDSAALIVWRNPDYHDA